MDAGGGGESLETADYKSHWTSINSQRAQHQAHILERRGTAGPPQHTWAPPVSPCGPLLAALRAAPGWVTHHSHAGASISDLASAPVASRGGLVAHMGLKVPPYRTSELKDSSVLVICLE